jgi:hypothetical protein
VNANVALLDPVVLLGPLVIDVFGATVSRGVPGASASRIVRTTVPCVARAASQSSNAASVLGRTQP